MGASSTKGKLSLHKLLRLLKLSVFLVIGIFLFILSLYLGILPLKNPSPLASETTIQANAQWQPPSLQDIPTSPDGDLIRYGKELVSHTATYLGPKGKVKAISNGMNCKNCHMESGTRAFGINYAAVSSTYPQWRERSGTVIDISERINECIERSLNGTKLLEGDLELEAIKAYLLWIGKDVPKGINPEGTGVKKIKFLERPADPIQGKVVYLKHCVECHGNSSEGELEDNGIEWKYPPVFGAHSYNIGAGLYRLSKFASFVKYNMPYGITYDEPVLTDEEAWDVAAFVNSMPHPTKDLSDDWPDISKKPIDHPFGPYADDWPEERHKYGPFID